jgi:hypothetical protein
MNEELMHKLLNLIVGQFIDTGICVDQSLHIKQPIGHVEADVVSSGLIELTLEGSLDLSLDMEFFFPN